MPKKTRELNHGLIPSICTSQNMDPGHALNTMRCVKGKLDRPRGCGNWSSHPKQCGACCILHCSREYPLTFGFFILHVFHLKLTLIILQGPNLRWTMPKTQWCLVLLWFSMGTTTMKSIWISRLLLSQFYCRIVCCSLFYNSASNWWTMSITNRSSHGQVVVPTWPPTQRR